MDFKVVSRSSGVTKDIPDRVFLAINNWDDLSYSTVYMLFYINTNLTSTKIGDLRIGHIGQSPGVRRPKSGEEFSVLGDNFFSLGVGTDYYENLNKLSKDVREQILRGVRDIAFLPDVFELAENEEVTKKALFRGIDPKTVTGQLRRMANGGAKLTKFEFWFNSPKMKKESPEMLLSFRVLPESNPPTNVHVIIGRNGVGKTRLINNMHSSLYHGEETAYNGVYFKTEDQKFVNVVFVSFSAFDTTKPVFDEYSNSTGLYFKYIGLKINDEGSPVGFRIKTKDELANEFLSSLIECIEAFKTDSLIKSLTSLESDPNFKEANILQILNLPIEERWKMGLQLFDKLSSGHKIILLSITRLVETVQEKSLVFIDEPEGHLHPPLLSAFIRSLSVLLTDVNGVAIIATHSPVILQEVPKNCVYKLRRVGANAFAERLEIESFGENVGTLTREVFGLEVTDSGFYQLLKKAVDKFENYDALVGHFDGELGMEARSIVRVLYANKSSIL